MSLRDQIEKLPQHQVYTYLRGLELPPVAESAVQLEPVLALIAAHESRLTALVEKWRDYDHPMTQDECADDLAVELKR